MFVNKINTYNFSKYFCIGSQKQVSRATYPNLAPLQQDTVSFRGVENKFDASCAEKPNFNDCNAVHDYAAAPAYYMYKIFDSYFSDFLEFTDTHTSTDILGIKHKKAKSKADKFGTFEIRTKSPASIYEKVISKFDRLYKKEHNDFAEELYQNMIVLFPPMPDVTKDQIMAVIAHSTDDSTSIKTSAFEHPEQTIREMLTMTTVGSPSAWFVSGNPDRTHHYFNNKRATHPSGSYWAYDSAGTQVLCALVEKLSGKSLLA